MRNNKILKYRWDVPNQGIICYKFLQNGSCVLLLCFLVIHELDWASTSEKTRNLKKKFSWFLTPPEGPSLYPHISALGWLIKNRLDDPKSMPLGTKHAKFHDSTMIRLGCRGGGLLKGVAHLLFGSHLYLVNPLTNCFWLLKLEFALSSKRVFSILFFL